MTRPWLLVALALAACQGGPTTPSKPKPKASAAPVVTAASATPQPSHVPVVAPPPPAPSPSPTPTPAPTPTPPPPVGALGVNVAGAVPGTWQAGPPLRHARAGLGLGVTGDRLLALEGDSAPSFERLASDGARWELESGYDAALVPIPQGQKQNLGYSQAAAVAVDNYLIMVGGAFLGPGGLAYRYNDRGLTDPAGYLAPYTGAAAAAGAVSGRVLVAGGWAYDGTSGDPMVLSKAGTIDLVSGATAEIAPPPKAVAGATAVTYAGKLYLFGGYTLDAAFKPVAEATVQAYDPVADSWTRDGAGAAPAALPAARSCAAAALVGDKVYVAGGFDATGKPLASVAVYDFKARSWSTAPSLPTARALLGLAAYQGALWAVGGVGADKAAGTTVEVFHP